MGKDSAIEWTHSTFNPWWGCEKVSPECTNCYADTLDKRLGGEHWGKGKARRFFADKHWNEPLKWNAEAAAAGERRRVFCASMADVFEDRDDLEEMRARLYALTLKTPHLDWLLLTKRPEHADRLWAGACADAFDGAESIGPTWKANHWLGTSVGCNETLWRLGELIKVRAVVRFVSAEPLLEEINLRPWLHEIDWVIGGGESGAGPRIRPTLVAAARALRDQCVADGVPFLWKQNGQFVAADQAPSLNHIEACSQSVEIGGEVLWRVRKKKDAGRLLDGRTWDEYPTPKEVGRGA